MLEQDLNQLFTKLKVAVKELKEKLKLNLNKVAVKEKLKLNKDLRRDVKKQ